MNPICGPQHNHKLIADFAGVTGKRGSLLHSMSENFST